MTSWRMPSSAPSPKTATPFSSLLPPPLPLPPTPPHLITKIHSLPSLHTTHPAPSSRTHSRKTGTCLGHPPPNNYMPPRSPLANAEPRIYVTTWSGHSLNLTLTTPTPYPHPPPDPIAKPQIVLIAPSWTPLAPSKASLTKRNTGHVPTSPACQTT